MGNGRATAILFGRTYAALFLASDEAEFIQRGESRMRRSEK
jgi:hypothetical protein